MAYGAQQYHNLRSCHKPTLKIGQNSDHDPHGTTQIQATNIFKTTKTNKNENNDI